MNCLNPPPPNVELYIRLFCTQNRRCLQAKTPGQNYQASNRVTMLTALLTATTLLFAAQIEARIKGGPVGPPGPQPD